MLHPLKHGFGISALALLIGLGTPHAMARDISGPSVKAGELRVKNTGFWGEDNDSDGSSLTNSTEFSFGINGRIALKAEGDWSKAPSDRVRYRGTELKAQYEIFQPGEAWIDTAVELGYVAASDPDRADAVNFEFLLQKEYLRMRHRANIEFAQQIGEFNEGGTTWAFDWQSMYKITPALLAGVEYYGTLGEVEDVFGNASDEEHLIGPVVSFDFTINNKTPASVEVGYLFGLTDASADHGLKWRFSLAF